MAELYQPVKIQWNFTNHCNFNCEYCPDVLKSGSIALPQPNQFSKAFCMLYEKFDKIEISLIGGEPTHYKGLDWALDKIINDPQKRINLETNGSRDLQWWEKYSNFFASIIITYHESFLKLDHLLTLLKILKNKKIYYLVKLPITPKNWGKLFEVKYLLESKNHKVEIQLLYKNFTKGSNQYFDYSEEQLKFYYKDKKIEESELPHQKEFKKVNNLNQFRGHMCWSGIDQLVINRFGDVYRGWCEQGGKLGNIFIDNINWPQNPIMCQKYLCNNGFDLEARKSKNSWGNI